MATLGSDRLIVWLTPDQLHALMQIVDNASIRGNVAALVVSIQQAFADAQPSGPSRPALAEDPAESRA